MSKEKKTSA